jgi:hypothetical protein
MSLNLVTLTFELQDAADDAGTGGVTIAPTSVVTAAGQTVVSQTPVVRQFSGGTTSVQVVACDSEGTIPAAGFWAYLITLPGGSPQLYLPNYSNGATQRFDSLTPVVAQTTYGPAAASGAVTSVFGRTGTVTAQSGDYTAAETGALAAEADSTSVPAAALVPQVVTLTGTSVTPNAALGNVFEHALTGNTTYSAPANPEPGQTITICPRQPASGGPYTVTFATGSAGDYSGGSGTIPAASTAANAVDRFAFTYDAHADDGAGAWCCLNSGGLGY